MPNRNGGTKPLALLGTLCWRIDSATGRALHGGKRAETRGWSAGLSKSLECGAWGVMLGK